jgi:predicted TIM-barrel fold metal-dependent hydrolase
MMKIFDVHTHVFPDKVAARALEHLQRKSHGIPVFCDGTRADQLRLALETGYTGLMNCPVVTNPGQMQSVNDRVASWNAWPYLSMGGVHPAAENALEELQRIKELGLHGVKLHPEYQEFELLEKRMDGIWARCESLGLPVLVHAGNDIGCPESERACPADFAELARRYPGLEIICAHMGGWRNWDLVERDLVGRRVWLDTSFSLPYMPDQSQFKRIILQHGTDRVLYGTDSPWQSLQSGLNEILLLDLPEQDIEQILWGNAARLFHLETVAKGVGHDQG